MTDTPVPPEAPAPAPAPPPAPAPTPTPAKRSHQHRSVVGRTVAALVAVGSAVGIGTGIHNASQAPTAAVQHCGGNDRWPVKVGNDPSAGAVSMAPQLTTIAAMNQVQPGPLDQPDGRMNVEKAEYTVQGYLGYFTHEADGDYHVVLTDGAGGYASGKSPGTGHSLVVEIPDPACFAGAKGTGSSASRFAQSISDVRTDFENVTQSMDGAKLPLNKIPVTVTGVAFFDFYHGQTGHAVVQMDQGQPKVIELHPVTAISFPNAAETDSD